MKSAKGQATQVRFGRKGHGFDYFEYIEGIYDKYQMAYEISLLFPQIYS